MNVYTLTHNPTPAEPDDLPDPEEMTEEQSLFASCPPIESYTRIVHRPYYYGEPGRGYLGTMKWAILTPDNADESSECRR